MPLARHDDIKTPAIDDSIISTHMPLARHDGAGAAGDPAGDDFYSHASCEA